MTDETVTTDMIRDALAEMLRQSVEDNDCYCCTEQWCEYHVGFEAGAEALLAWLVNDGVLQE